MQPEPRPKAAYEIRLREQLRPIVEEAMEVGAVYRIPVAAIITVEDYPPGKPGSRPVCLKLRYIPKPRMIIVQGDLGRIEETFDLTEKLVVAK